MTDLEEMKKKLREEMWNKMQEHHVARFPGPFGRIPNFVGSQIAAFNLAQAKVWQISKTIKVNPDSPQAEVRRLALLNGMTLSMPTPRLRSGFLLLDPKRMERQHYGFASTIKGAFTFGRETEPKALPKIDLVVVGSVAVDKHGNRVGKGEGYSEIEWAIAREEGKVDENTTVATTVHDLQLVDRIPKIHIHDLPVDLIVTPTNMVEVKRENRKPEHIYWDLLSDKKIKVIPLLYGRWKTVGQSC